MLDGRDEAIVKQAFPEGSTSYLFPHYKVDVVDGDRNMAIAMSRVGVRRRTTRIEVTTTAEGAEKLRNLTSLGGHAVLSVEPAAVARLPRGLRRGHDDSIACPHRDLSCCPECITKHAPALVEVGGRHYWVPDPSERAELAREGPWPKDDGKEASKQ